MTPCKTHPPRTSPISLSRYLLTHSSRYLPLLASRAADGPVTRQHADRSGRPDGGDDGTRDWSGHDASRTQPYAISVATASWLRRLYLDAGRTTSAMRATTPTTAIIAPLARAVRVSAVADAAHVAGVAE